MSSQLRAPWNLLKKTDEFIANSGSFSIFFSSSVPNFARNCDYYCSKLSLSINSGYSYLESEFLAQTPVVIYLGILKRFFVFSFCIYYFSFFRAFSLTCLSCGENYTNKTRNNFLYYHSIQRFFDIHIF